MSPGGTAHSGIQVGAGSVAMVVNHLLYRDPGDLCCVDAAVLETWHRRVSWFEDEPVGAPQINGELPSAVGAELMASPRDSLHVFEGRRREQRGEAPLEGRPMLRSPPSAPVAVGGTLFLQLAARPCDVDSWRSLMAFTPRV